MRKLTEVTTSGAEDGTERLVALLRSRSGVPPRVPAEASVAGGWVPAAPPGVRGERGPDRGSGRQPVGGEEGPVDRSSPGRHRAPPPRVLTVPAFLRAGRVRVRLAAVAGLVLVAALAAAVFAVRVVAAQRDAQPVVVSPTRSAVVGRSVPVSFAGTATASLGPSGATPVPIVVHVVGQVATPGVVTVPAGARVIDAITAAGGSVRGADLQRINLARPVIDGEQVHVPAPGEPLQPGAFGATLSGGSPPGQGAGSPTGRALVNLNTADLAALEDLPGVGPVLAQRILDWRTAHGRFTSVDELGEVSGIGERMLAQLTPYVTV